MTNALIDDQLLGLVLRNKNPSDPRIEEIVHHWLLVCPLMSGGSQRARLNRRFISAFC